MIRILMIVLLFVATSAGVVNAKDEACTDGVDCLCDLFSGDPDIVFCEDFENPNLPNAADGPDGQGGWHNIYGSGSSGCLYNPNPGSGTGYTRFGRTNSPQCCLDTVQEGNCDPVGQTDCVFQGTSALAHRAVPGKTGGKTGADGWTGGSQRRFGYTMAVKWSDNYVTPGNGGLTGVAHKMNEFGSQDSPLLGAVSHDRDNPYGMSVLKMFAPDGAWTNVQGTAYNIDGGNKWWMAHDQTKYRWESGTPAEVNAAPGEWICMQIHWNNWGLSNGHIRAWMNGVKTQEISNINMTNMTTGGGGVGSFVFNNYYNGNACGGECRTGYPITSPSGARLEDNIIVTKGPEPVPCEDIGFNGISAPPYWATLSGTSISGGSIQ